MGRLFRSMKSNQEVLDDFSVKVDRFLHATIDERREAALMYACRDARPFVKTTTDYEAYHLDNDVSGKSDTQSSLFVASIAPAYLRAAIGMALKASKKFSAYSTDPMFRNEVDIMNDGMQWATKASRYNVQKGLAFEDACVRGVGGMITYLDFSIKDFPFGVPTTARKYHLFYDRGGMDDVSSGNTGWCGYADPVYRDNLEEYVERKGGYEEEKGNGGSTFREEFLEYTTTRDENDIDFIYNWFWREYVTVYDTVNPFVIMADQLLQGGELVPEIFELLSSFAQKHQVDIKRSSIITLDKEAHTEFRDLIDNFEFLTGMRLDEVKSTAREARCYYRCQIADGRIIKGTKSQAFTRECHPLNIITAYYDRAAGCYYGLMRSAAYLQEALNDVMSDALTYSRRSATGGTIGIVGAGTDIGATIQRIREKEQAFPLPEGSNIIGLQTQDAAANYQNMSALLIKLVPMVMGVPPEIMGQINDDTPASSLFKQQVEQMSVSLSHIMNGMEIADLNQALIFRDLIMEMARSTDGSIVLPVRSSGHEVDEFVMLSQDNIARSYAVELVEQDAGEDERHDQFMKLIDFANLLPDAQRVAVMPELLTLSNMDEQGKDRIAQLLQPPPPPQPDPIAQELAIAQQQANIRMINAQAAQLEGEATLSMQQAPTEQQRELVEIDKERADTEKKRAETELTQAKTMQAEIEAGSRLAGNNQP